MSCSTCIEGCGLKSYYFSTSIPNPLYYSQTINGNTKFYAGISTSLKYCDTPNCEQMGNFVRSIIRKTASVSNTVDDQGNYILTVLVKENDSGQHGYYLPAPDDYSNFTCPDALSFTQEATILNNGTGTTKAKLKFGATNCCDCSYTATYNASNPFEAIEWIQNSDGCGQGFIVCSPNQGYITIGPVETLCLPPACPNSSYAGDDTIINMIQEIKAEDFLKDQQKVIDVKSTFSVDWQNGLGEQGRTIPNPISTGRLVRLKPYLDINTLDKVPVTIEVTTEDCELLETFQTTASQFLNEEIKINLAKYAVASEKNESWGPDKINKKVVFKMFTS